MSGGCFQQTNRKTAVLASLNEFINNIPTCLLFPSTVFKQFLYLVIFVPFQVIPQKKSYSFDKCSLSVSASKTKVKMIDHRA